MCIRDRLGNARHARRARRGRRARARSAGGHLRTQCWRTVFGAAQESPARMRARADRDLGRLLALGTCALPVPRLVVLARAWAADARAQGLHSDGRWLGRIATAAWSI